MNTLQRFYYQWQLKRAKHQCQANEVWQWLQHLPDLNTPISQASFLALDFETTGLNPRKDQIVSMGWVPVEKGRIAIGKGEHHIIATPAMLEAESIKVHGLTHQVTAQGAPLEKVLPRLWEALQGRLPLVHFARIEKNFLAQAMKQHYGCAPPVAMVDTFDLAVRSLPPHTGVEAGKLRLHALRQQHHLPTMPPHHALEDAIATAELFLAQLKRRADYSSLTVQDIIV